jgi:enoyl-CoA hydratase/carnithine racemase
VKRWTVERHDRWVLARHDNPPMNYLTARGTVELSELVEQWRDPSIRAVVLAGAVPGRFITHYSVEELVKLSRDREALVRTGPQLTDDYHALLQRISDLPKPVIVAMNGDTMGGGFEIALSSDIRIGELGDYRYGLPEVRLGILPGGSGTQRLPRLIGSGRAIEFILRGRIVGPERALELGLVHELADDAVAHAAAVAEELVRMPPVSMAQVKIAVYEGSQLPLAEGLRIESAASLRTRLSDDAVMAMQTYVDLPPEVRRDWLEGGELPEFSGA